MSDICLIYQNECGITFLWKPDTPNKNRKVQLIFRNIGLLLSPSELHYFSKCIQETLQSGRENLCSDCSAKKSCRSLLLNSPAHQITFAVSFQEAVEIEDLIRGTMFKLQLDSFFDDMGIGS